MTVSEAVVLMIRYRSTTNFPDVEDGAESSRRMNDNKNLLSDCRDLNRGICKDCLNCSA